MADVDPSKYDADAKENVLFEELYPHISLTETKPTTEEVHITCQEDDLNFDFLSEQTGTNAGNNNKDTPDKKKRRKENPTKGAKKTATAAPSAPQPSSSNPKGVAKVAAAKAPIKPVTSKTQPPPPKLEKANKTVTSSVPPRV